MRLRSPSTADGNDDDNDHQRLLELIDASKLAVKAKPALQNSQRQPLRLTGCPRPICDKDAPSSSGEHVVHQQVSPAVGVGREVLSALLQRSLLQKAKPPTHQHRNHPHHHRGTNSEVASTAAAPPLLDSPVRSTVDDPAHQHSEGVLEDDTPARSKTRVIRFTAARPEGVTASASRSSISSSDEMSRRDSVSDTAAPSASSPPRSTLLPLPLDKFLGNVPVDVEDGVAASGEENKPALIPPDAPLLLGSVSSTSCPEVVTTYSVPTDFSRAKHALDCLRRTCQAAKRCDDLSKSLKYIHDGMTMMAIDSFSKTDLWRILGYQGTTEDARYFIKKRALNIHLINIKAQVMGTNAAAMIDEDESLKISHSSVRHVEGVKIDDATETLLSLLQFLDNFAMGKFVTHDVLKSNIDFGQGAPSAAQQPPPTHPPPASAGQQPAVSKSPASTPKTTPLSSRPASASVASARVASTHEAGAVTGGDSVQLQSEPSHDQLTATHGESSAVVAPSTAAAAAPAAGATPPHHHVDVTHLVTAARLKELHINLKYAHDMSDRNALVTEEECLQRYLILQVLALVAMDQLEQDLDEAKRRLRTCEQLKERFSRNPHRTDADMQSCIELIDPLRDAIQEASIVTDVFESQQKKRFQKAISQSVHQLLLFNREVHRWNGYVDGRRDAHIHAKRRTWQSCFTVMTLLEKGVLSVEKNPEVFLKIQLFEKLQSSLTLVRAAPEYLIKYKKKLAQMDNIRPDRITEEDEARWMVEIKGKKIQRTMSLQQAPAALPVATAAKHAANPRRGTITLGSKPAALPRAVTTITAARFLGTRIGTSATGSSATSRQEPQPPPDEPKRWKFKLYQEANDDEREGVFGTLYEMESIAVAKCVQEIVSFLEDMLKDASEEEKRKETEEQERREAEALEQRGLSGASGSSFHTTPRKASPPRSGTNIGTLISSQQQPSASRTTSTRFVVSDDAAFAIAPMLFSKLPRKVQIFVRALIETAMEMLKIAKEQVDRWDDNDLVIEESESEDTPAAGEGRQSMSFGSRHSDMEKSSASIFSTTSSLQSRAEIPRCHLPPGYVKEMKDPVKDAKALLEKVRTRVDELISAIKLPIKGLDVMLPAALRGKRKPKKGLEESRCSASQELSMPSFFPMGIDSPNAKHSTSLSSPSDASMIIVPKHASDSPKTLPIPTPVRETTQQQRDLVVLRPGAPIVPRPPSSSHAKTKPSLVQELLTTMQYDAQGNEIVEVRSKPFWHFPPPPQWFGGDSPRSPTPGHHLQQQLQTSAMITEKLLEADGATSMRRLGASQSRHIDEWDVEAFVMTDTGNVRVNTTHNKHAGGPIAQLKDEGGTSPIVTSLRPGTASRHVLAEAAKQLGSRPSSSSRWTPKHPFH